MEKIENTMDKQERIDRAWLETAMTFGYHMSKDPECKVGAIIVTPDNMLTSFGYNGFPIGVRDDADAWKDKDRKNALVVHAEVNAIIKAPFNTEGCTLYCNRKPCQYCLGVAANARIHRIVYFSGPRWNHFDEAIFQEIANANPMIAFTSYDRAIY